MSSMATEKEIVDGSEKKEEDVNPNEVEKEDLEEEADKVGEKAEEPGKECGDEEEEKADREDDELKEETKDEVEEDEEKADREDDEMRAEDEDETKHEEEVEDKDEEKETEEEEESEKKIEMSKKRSRKQTKNEIGVLGSPRTPGSERPTRERKTVERFMLGEIPRASVSKTLSIEKGQGTQLKDIPNVAFKLSKRKADENLQLLHSILFGKKSKVHTLKKNLGLFSGFVWVENEEKQRAKIKDKIEKCVKEKLVDFCDILNIHVNKTTTKKEEISAKLLEFLESPHSTTDSLLADKEKKGKKRKSSSSTSKSPSLSSATAGNSKKKQKLDAESGKKAKHSTGEDDTKSESSQSEEDHDHDNIIREAESDKEELHSEEGTDEDEPKKSGKKDTDKTVLKSKPVGKGSDEKTSKTNKKPLSSTSKKEAEPVSKRKSKAPLSKKKKDEEESEEDKDVPTKGTSSSKKKSSKSSDKKEQGKGKSTKEPEKQPSREEMHSAVADMLKEVDFNTVTLADILRQLGKHFGVDLMHRKAEVKEIITEVIESMSDDEDVEEAEAGDESRKDGDDE